MRMTTLLSELTFKKQFAKFKTQYDEGNGIYVIHAQQRHLDLFTQVNIQFPVWKLNKWWLQHKWLMKKKNKINCHWNWGTKIRTKYDNGYSYEKYPVRMNVKKGYLQ